MNDDMNRRDFLIVAGVGGVATLHSFQEEDSDAVSLPTPSSVPCEEHQQIVLEGVFRMWIPEGVTEHGSVFRSAIRITEEAMESDQAGVHAILNRFLSEASQHMRKFADLEDRKKGPCRPTQKKE